MIELTVKTLDSKNHVFSVPDDLTVRELKDRIADSVNITPDSQRLIYCGRVLQDDKNLSEYNVNGKVIHLVQRAPPGTEGNGPDRGSSSARSASVTGTRRTPLRSLFGAGGNTGNAMYLGAMAFPAEFMDASGIPLQQPRQCLSQSRLTVVRNMLRRASVVLNRLENPPQESSDTSPENENGQSETNTEEDNGTASGGQSGTVEISPDSFFIDNQQIDVGGPSVEIQTESVVEPTVTSTNETQPDTTNSEQPPSQNDNDETENGTSRFPRTRALADLLDQAADINTRVQPYMAQYQQLMRDDPVFTDQVAVATNQRLFTSVSEIMHNLAHAYHALSDIMCDFSQQPPRFLRCRPVLIHHSAVVQTGIPIQVSSNLGASSNNQQNTNSGNSETNESANVPASSTDTGSTTNEDPISQPSTTSQSPENPSPAANDEPPPTQSSVSTTATSQDSATRQPRSPSFSPPRIARIGSGGNGGPGFEIFVDVGPGQITIDSVEATVVTNTTPNTSETQTWQNPPEFVQNLISALAGQFMGATLQQYRFPDQQSSSTNIQQNTTSTNLQQNVAAGTQPSQPATSTQQNQSTFTTQQNTDSQPTVSSHQNANSQSAASTQQNANSQPAGGSQNSQARGNTATHPTTATQTRSTARPHVHLSPSSIQNLRSNNFDPFLPCNSHHIRSSRGGRQRTVQVTNALVDAGGRVVPIAPPSISISVRADTVHNGDQNATRNATSQHVRTVPFPGLQALIQAARNHTATHGGDHTRATLAEMLQHIPGYSYNPGESIFFDIFMALAQSLSFMDLVQLGIGNSDCLVRARPHLRQLISQHLLNNEPLTISAITQIIDRFNTEIRPYFTVLDNVRLREEVDVVASINLYNHSMLPSILNTVMEEDPSTFHATLMRKCSLYIRQLCALIQYCCLDGVAGFEDILRAFLNLTANEVPGVLPDWTVAHSLMNFRLFLSSVNVPSEDIKRFLVYHINNPDASPQPANTPPLVLSAAEPMDTQELEELEIGSTPSCIREPPVAAVPPTPQMNEVTGWQSTLTSEWVPIITRDSQRQRRQNSQGPFSDAYLTGMPSKRRKLITSAKPQGNLSQVISESMSTALGAAGVSSGPEVDVIAQRAGQDGTLRAAYREQVRTTLRQNINSNPDYLPDKYPNTAKYIKKQ